MIKCDSCGWTNIDGVKCCEKCGNPLRKDCRQTVIHPNNNEKEPDRTRPIDDNKGRKGLNYSIVAGIVEILVGFVLVIYQVAVLNKARGFLYYFGFCIAITGAGHISAVIKKNKESR